MKRYTYERKLAYLLLHQICMVAMVICIYAYEYVVLKSPNKDEFVYLLISFLGFFGGISFLLISTRIDKRISKKKYKKTIIDKFYPEILVGIMIIVLISLGSEMKNIEISKFSLSGLVITTGSIAYIMDTIFLVGYFSIVHRVVNRQLKLESLSFLIWSLWKNRKTGKSLKDISRKAKEQEKIRDALSLIAEGQMEITLDESEFHGQELEIASYINRIQEGLKEAVERRIKDEKMKADLITNVSHDIKTPLTSIVNYVDLVKREKLENENANNYIRIIDEKAHRLKLLTEDLVEVSKISSGNIKLDVQTIDFLELLYQTGGEFNERFEARNLTIITKLPGVPVLINADGRQLYRTIENLYTNAAKYAQENTNIYVELLPLDEIVVFTIKNIAKPELQIAASNYEELTERFVRGEASRTTEGSGLGLSIAKSLTVLMGGTFHIQVDGETFTARITFPLANGN